MNINITQASMQESGTERERVHKVMAKLNAHDNGLFFALNRYHKTAVALDGFSCFEEIKCAFRFGIQMPDGNMANGIGRCSDHADFIAKANHGNWTVLTAVNA